jgi:hypothetical protein
MLVSSSIFPALSCTSFKVVKTISAMGGGAIKENDGGGEFNYDIFDTL